MIKGPFLWACLKEILGCPGGSEGKASAVMRETQVQSLGWEDPLEKEMATHSSILVWRTPLMEEPGGLQSTGSQRVGHDWVTTLYTLKEIRSYAWRSLLVVQGLYIYLWKDIKISTHPFHLMYQQMSDPRKNTESASWIWGRVRFC